MTRRVVYCHCAWAKAVPERVKQDVLARLGASEREFEAVPDLCEMAARCDPTLAEYADDPTVDIVACYPRAVRWLFHAGGQKLHEESRVLNMRTADASEILAELDQEPAPAGEAVP